MNNAIRLALKRSQGLPIVKPHPKTDWDLVSEAAWEGVDECWGCDFHNENECDLGILDGHKAWQCPALDRLRKEENDE